MGRVVIAFRAFFAALFNGATALRVRQALNNPGLLAPESPIAILKPVDVASHALRKPVQSEAITLLATLQREARFVDFVKENLSGYSDEQVGVAVREIQRDSAAVLDRFFAIRPILNDDEGAAIAVPSGFDATRYRLIGKVTGNAPFHGTLRHHGWEVTQCELPEFTGNDAGTKTIAPAEVEIQ